MKHEVSTVEYEHPEYGTLRVLFHWEAHEGGFFWRPWLIECDLFTPDSEIEALRALLKADRVDSHLA